MEKSNIKEMVKIAYAALDDKKAINPEIIVSVRFP